MGRITIELKSKSKREMLIKVLDALNISYKEDYNPSPSGDIWFLDARNLEEAEKGRSDVKSGKVNERSLSDIKDLLGI